MSHSKEEKSTWLAESRLAAIVDSCDDAIIGLALDGTITSWNKAAEKIFGYSAREAVGQNIAILIPPDRSDEEPRILNRVANGEHVQHYESVRRRKDGTLVDVSLTNSPIRDPQGNIVGVSKIARDITAQKRANELLRANEEKYRVTLSSIGDAVIATDPQGRVTFMNGRAEELTGWPQAEALGKPLPEIFDIVNEMTRRTVENPVDKVIEHGQVVGLANHTVLRSRNGVEYAIDDSAAPIRDAQQQLVGVVLVFHDVTEARKSVLAQRKLAAIVESSDDAIISKNLDGYITSWNKGAERIFGYTAEEAIGKHVTFIIPPERQSEEPGILERLRRGERVDHYETVRVARDGRRIDISLTISPIRDEEGHIIGASKIARDITAQKLSAELLRASEEKYRVTLSSIGDAVIATDAQGLVTFMNGRAEQLTGWTQAEAVAKPLPEIFDIVNEMTRRKVENPVDKVLAHGNVVGLANHTVLLNRRGVEYAIDDSAAPIRDALQQLMGVVLVFHDVTEARKASLAQRRLAAIVESSADAIVSKNLDGYITSWNKGAERIFGYTPEEAVGKHITLIIPPERQNEEPVILERLRRGERIDHFETIRMAKDGRRLNISLTISPIRNDEGAVVGASKIARDITAQKAAEAAVKEAQAQLQAYAVTLEERVAERTSRLQEVNKSLEGLSYSIAHDLRAPLRAIQGMTEILLEDHAKQFDANGQRVAGEIIKSVRRMDNLITDLMSYGRLSHDELPSGVVHVDEVVKHVVRNMELEIKDAQASVDIAKDLPVVKAHRPTLEQIVTNLVNNAVKFVEPTRPARVRIYGCEALASRDGYVRVVVEDNGIGIQPEFRERIYRIFERLHAGNRYPGTGIGLAIVQKGIERMGGRTGVESEPGRGSRFWFELPRA